jgi:hypothetical protein
MQFDLAEAHEMDLELRLPKVGISLDWVYGELEGAPCQADPDDVNTLFLKKGPFWTMGVWGRSRFPVISEVVLCWKGLDWPILHTSRDVSLCARAQIGSDTPT